MWVIRAPPQSSNRFGVLIRYALPAGIALETAFNNSTFVLLLLPIVMFHSGFTGDNRSLLNNCGTVLLFATLGTLLSAVSCPSGDTACKNRDSYYVSAPRVQVVLGNVLFWAGYAGASVAMTWAEAMAYASALSATDPVATLSIFSSLRVHPTLNALVFGEAVANDGAGSVLYRAFLQFTLEPVTGTSVGAAIGDFVMLMVASMGLGCVVAAAGIVLLRHSDVRLAASTPMIDAPSGPTRSARDAAVVVIRSASTRADSAVFDGGPAAGPAVVDAPTSPKSTAVPPRVREVPADLTTVPAHAPLHSPHQLHPLSRSLPVEGRAIENGAEPVPPAIIFGGQPGTEAPGDLQSQSQSRSAVAVQSGQQHPLGDEGMSGGVQKILHRSPSRSRSVMLSTETDMHVSAVYVQIPQLLAMAYATFALAQVWCVKLMIFFLRALRQNVTNCSHLLSLAFWHRGVPASLQEDMNREAGRGYASCLAGALQLCGDGYLFSNWLQRCTPR